MSEMRLYEKTQNQPNLMTSVYGVTWSFESGRLFWGLAITVPERDPLPFCSSLTKATATVNDCTRRFSRSARHALKTGAEPTAAMDLNRTAAWHRSQML
jgi:hypothetical protein